MKRSVVFILTVILAAGFLIGAYQTIGGYGDDVTVTPHHVYGDPANVAGIVMELETQCDNHMLWYTRHTAGDPGMTETEFIFSQDNVNEYNWDWDHDFDFYISGGFGISTSGGSIDVGNTGWGKVINQLAKDVQNGQTLEKEILLEDYFEYYPMDYHVMIQTSMYYIDEFKDSTQDGGYESGSYGRWTKDFKFPVLPGDKGHVTLTKSQDGGIIDLGVQVYDIGEAGFTTCIWDEGMYFAPVFRDYAGNPRTDGEFVQGYGLYHIPFKVDSRVEFHSETTMYAGWFDHENRELIYPLDSDDLVVAMEADEKGTLHMIFREDGLYRYCALDIESRTITHKIDLMKAGQEQWCNYKFFLDQGLIYLQYDNQVALLDVSGEPSLEFVIAIPKDIDFYLPDTVSYRDGTLYTAALDWVVMNEGEPDETWERGYYLTAMDKEGLGYFGYYFTSLMDKGHSYAYVSQNEIRIVE